MALDIFERRKDLEKVKTSTCLIVGSPTRKSTYAETAASLECSWVAVSISGTLQLLDMLRRRSLGPEIQLEQWNIGA
jgi:hypothetical protein